MMVEPGRGVALGPNKWGVSWVPDSTELCRRCQRPPAGGRQAQPLSACAGAVMATRLRLSVAVTTATATLRAMFMIPLHLRAIGSHGRPGVTSVGEQRP